MFRWIGVAALGLAGPVGASTVVDFENFAVGTQPGKAPPLPYGVAYPLYHMTFRGTVGGDDSNHYLYFTPGPNNLGFAEVKFYYRRTQVNLPKGQSYVEKRTFTGVDLYSTKDGIDPHFPAGVWTHVDLNFSTTGDDTLFLRFADDSEIRLDNLTYTIERGPAVPESSTWAMMLIGFGGIGGFMRHRSQRTGPVRRIAA